MNEIKITQEGNILIVANRCGIHRFEIVDEVPLGYEVWNIGTNMAPGYLPLCRLCAVQPFDGGRNIEPDTLKAIRVDGAEKILKATHYAKTPWEMERYVEKNEGSKNKDVQYRVRLFKEALPVMNEIKWSRWK